MKENNIKTKNPSSLLQMLVLFCVPIGNSCGPSERRLLNDLLTYYHKMERPVANESEAIQLKFGLTLQQIMNVDAKNQILMTNIWLNLEWTDNNLRWNETEYGNVKDIRFPPNLIWTPDILMYNSASEAFDSTFPTNVVVTSAGLCTYIPPGMFKSSCPIDITWFPFDEQNCEMKFGSWTYNGLKVDFKLQSDEGDTTTFIPNGEWDLLGVPAQQNEVIYDCCPEPYLDITFIIKIRRRTLYYFYNLIVPCLLISSMAVLDFTLPPDSGEKLALSVTILLSMTIFLATVQSIIPITSDSPLIATYFNGIMLMVAASVVTTILVLNYHHRQEDTHEMPDWVQLIFLQWIPWVLCMSRPGEEITRKSITIAQKMKEMDKKESFSKSLLANVLDIDDNFCATTIPQSMTGLQHVHIKPTNFNGCFTRSPHSPAIKDETAMYSPLQKELGLILKEIKVITEKIKDDDEAATVEGDWKFAAMVIDRLCLIIYTVFIIVATIAMLWTAPHVFVA